MTAMAVALIGFSEAGQAIGGGLAAAGATRVSAYDLRFGDGDAGKILEARAAALGVEAAGSAAHAAAGADFVLSAVTAGAALAVAREAAAYLRPGQVFVDLNSISPADKRAGADPVEAAGAAYVEAAIMSPVGSLGHAVPMLFGGPAAEAAAARLRALGMNIEVAGAEIGTASAIKMCRSIMLKGMEALAVECLMTARGHGVEDQVMASLDRTLPGIDWSARAAYMVGRVIAHGARRAEEMRCAADTVRGIGLEPLMAEATARRQQWVADLGIGACGEAAGLGDLADRLAAALPRGPAGTTEL